MNIEIANRLVQLRKEHGYSQETLAAALGLSRQAISKWERGESSPDLDNILELSRVYGITLDALLKGEEPPQNDVADVLQKAETPEETYDRARIEYMQAKEAYEQAEAAYFRNGFARRKEILQETETVDDDCEAGEQDGAFRLSASLYIDDEEGEKGPWCSFPYVPAAVIIYLLLGFLLGWWLEGTVLFLSIPLYYSVAKWLDDGRQGSLLKAIPYPAATVIIYLLLGFLFDIWHPGWIIFLTIPLYYAIAEFLAQRDK